jgi:hypothetical protein
MNKEANKRNKRGSYAKTRYGELDKYTEELKKRAGLVVGVIGTYRTQLLNVLTGEQEVKFYHNIIPTSGLTLLANNLTDATPDNDMLISHAALGSNVTPPALGDVKLGTETYRNAIASKTNSAGVAYATAYFNQTECNGTYKEAGIFCDGSLTPDDGILFSHVAIDVVKTNVQKLTIDWTFTIINA